MSLGLEKSVEVQNFTGYCADIGLRQPMQLSFAEIRTRPSGVAIMDIQLGNVGANGLGEGATLPEPYFTDDSGHNISANMRELATTFTGKKDSCAQFIEDIQRHEFRDGGRYPTARLAVEMSLIDAYCKATGVSVSSYLGTSDVTEVPFGTSIGSQTSEGMLKQAEHSISQGSRKIKLKVSPENTQEVVKAIEEIQRTHPGVEIMVDANGGFNPETREDISSIALLDELGLIMMEEPVSRTGALKGLEAIKLMRKKLPNLETAICLDDCLETYDDCLESLDTDLASIVNVKPGRIGSFVRSLDLIDYASSNGKQVMVGGMLEATPGRCMTVHLGAYCLVKGFNIPGDLSLAQERLSDDLVDEGKQLKRSNNGTIFVPNGNGWGV